MATNANWGIWGASPLASSFSSDPALRRPDELSPHMTHTSPLSSTATISLSATESSLSGPSERDVDLDLRPWASNSSSGRSPLWASNTENPNTSPVTLRKLPVDLDSTDGPREPSFFLSPRQRQASVYGSSQPQLSNGASSILMDMRSPGSMHASLISQQQQQQQPGQYPYGNAYASLMGAADDDNEDQIRDEYRRQYRQGSSISHDRDPALSPTKSHASQARMEEESALLRSGSTPPGYNNISSTIVNPSGSGLGPSQAQPPFAQNTFASHFRERKSLAEATREAELLANFKALNMDPPINSDSSMYDSEYSERRRMISPPNSGSPFTSFSPTSYSSAPPPPQNYAPPDNYGLSSRQLSFAGDDRYYQRGMVPQQLHSSMSEYDSPYNYQYATGSHIGGGGPDPLLEFRNPRHLPRGSMSSMDQPVDYRRALSPSYYSGMGGISSSGTPSVTQQQSRAAPKIPPGDNSKKFRPLSMQGALPSQPAVNVKPPTPSVNNIYRAQAPAFDFPTSGSSYSSTARVPPSSASASLSNPSVSRRASAAVSTPVSASSGDEFPHGVRSPLLEEFRSSKGKKYDLKDIYGHVVEFSGDQHGSRFIQQRLETANSDEKEAIFSEIYPNALQLMTDVFGNYVIQKFFEHGNQMQKASLAKQMEGNILTLSLQMYGCRVVQKAIEHVLVEQQAKLVKELEGHVLRCVKDQNGNHVIQKAIERVPAKHIEFIIRAFNKQVYDLATHPYGCRVIQRMLEHCDDEAQTAILGELHSFTSYLVQDQYGNYVIQHVIEQGRHEDREQIIMVVKENVLQFSKHKFASNVVEKCIVYGDSRQRQTIIDEILRVKADGSLPLTAMMKDQFANYVIQKLLDVTDGQQRDNLVSKIMPHLQALKKYSYGKHLVSIEKLMYLSGEEKASTSPTLSPTVSKNAEAGGLSRSYSNKSFGSQGKSDAASVAGELSTSLGDETNATSPMSEDGKSYEASFSSSLSQDAV